VKLVPLFLTFCALLFAGTVPAEKVSLQLQWLDQFQFAGYYMAVEKGFYKEAGLDVTIKPYRAGVLTTDEVVAGRAEYGIGRSSLLIDRLEGKPVVVLASVLQSSPDVLLARKDSGITSVKDFKGKRIMLTHDAQESITYQAMFQSEGISFNDVIRQEHSFNLDDLISGKTDLMACYLSNEPFVMKKRGIESVGFAPKDYGFNFYSDLLFTSEQELKEHPRRVSAFLDASLRGWEYAFGHIDESVDVILAHHNSQNKSRESLLYEARVLKGLAYAPETPLGSVSTERFKGVYDLYRVMGRTDKALGDLDAFVYRNAPTLRPFVLSEAEKAFLATHAVHVLSGGFGPSYHTATNSNGFPLTAIAYDMWMSVAERCDMDTTVEFGSLGGHALLRSVAEGKADVALGIDLPAALPESVLLSRPYGSFPYVIATPDSVTYIPNLAALEGKRVAVRPDSRIFDIIGREFPGIILVPVQTADGAVKLLDRGDVDAVVDLLPILGHIIEHGGYDSVKISGTTAYQQSLNFVVSRDQKELLAIIDKAIDATGLHERNEIFNRYTGPLRASVNYTLIFEILGVALMIIAMLIFRQRTLQRHNAELQTLAVTDKLTQIYNRIKLDQSLQEQIQVHKRYGHDFCVIIIDLDDFKQINDRYGHLAGDRVLVDVAQTLKQHLRRTDILGRWGGEEFMIVCQETGIQGGIKLARALHTILTNRSVGEIEHIRCSMGLTQVQESDTMDSVVQRADDALYEAKRFGKDRVVSR